ncbi:MAG: M48 family metalloprotease [Crenarchaeota archaeon]|nr:M48 family metalloprotease [Thermoproteota archaeon]
MYILLGPWWFGVGWLAASIASLVVAVGAAALAPKLLSGNPRSLGALRLGMISTGLAVVGISALLFWLVVELLGYSVSLMYLALLAAGIGVLQWLISPYIINMMYRVKPAGPELDWLRLELRRLAERSGLGKPPRLVVAETDAPNAFAYGNPLTGYYVAVTRGILRIMPREELVAVIGHELGHLRHRDVQVILALSLLPSIAYFIGRVLVDIGFFSGMAGGRDRDEGGSAILVLVGFIILVASIVLHFLVRHFSRLREYYADAHSAMVTGEPRLLQRALARLHVAYMNSPRLVRELRRQSAASMLLIVSYFYQPDIDTIVEELKRQPTNPLMELFSTHPPIPKRLRFLDALRQSLTQG